MPGTDDRDDSGDVLLETETGYRGGPGFADSAADELTIDDRGGLLAQAHPADIGVEDERAKVVVVSGVDEGRKFELTGRNVSIGRGMDNDIVLTDLAVSRRHLRIDKDGPSYFLQDQGSGNGTLLNGRDEDGRALLRHGDRIEIGNTVMRFEFPRLTLGYSNDPIQRPGPSAPPPAAPALPPRNRVPTTTPPQMQPRHAPDEVATQGQRPFSPRPSEAPPVPPPGPLIEAPPLNGGFSPIPPPAGGYSAGPPIPPPPGNTYPPPYAPPTQQQPAPIAYPQAPANYSSMNAVSAMRPRPEMPEMPHSPYPEARPVATAKTRALPWLWVTVALLGAGLLGTLIFVATRPSKPTVASSDPDVNVVATTDAGTAIAQKRPEVSVAPRVALLSGKFQPHEMPKELWGTNETRVASDAPPNTGTTVEVTPVNPVTPNPPVTPESGEELQQVRVKATELYEARSFSEASSTLKAALEGKSGPITGKLSALARDYSALGSLFDRGSRTTRSDPAASYRAWASARRLDARLGGAHKNFISQKQRGAAPAAAAKFLSAKDYASAREAAGMAGSDGEEVLERLEDEASKQVSAAKKLAAKGDPKSSIMARALLKKARSMVGSDSDTYQQAGDILERLER